MKNGLMQTRKLQRKTEIQRRDFNNDLKNIRYTVYA